MHIYKLTFFYHGFLALLVSMRILSALTTVVVIAYSSRAPTLRDADASIVPVIRTDFSSATIPVRVGPSRTPIQVQLSFVHSTSFLYSIDSCPAFVDCYSEALASSRTVNADLQIGSMTVEDYSFSIQIYEDDIRDTAGTVGFAPGSALASAYAARVSDESFAYRHDGQAYQIGGLQFELIVAPSVTELDSVIVPLLSRPSSDHWAFEASFIRLNGERIGTRTSRIVVDPTLSSIVIPHEYRSVVRDILELQVADIYEDASSGNIFVPCSKDGPPKAMLNLDISIPSGGSIRIKQSLSPLFPLRKIVRGDTYYCQTHFRFGSRLPVGPFDRHTWLIGDPLIRERPRGVIFDSTNNRLIVSPTGSEPVITKLFGVFPLTLRMPRYDPNVVIERPNDSLTVLKFRQKSSPADDGYVIRSRRLIGGRAVGILDFSLRNVDDLRSRKSVPTSPSASRQLDGLYHILDDTSNLRFDDDEKSVALYLTKAVSLDIPIYSVTLLTTSSISMISLRQVSDAIVDSGDLLLPEPVVKLGGLNETVTPEEPAADAASTISQCCICLCEFSAGDSVQGLPEPCTHRFHESCIKEWFSRGKRNCPLCQFKVPHGQNPIITRPSHAPGSHPSQGPSMYDVFASFLFAYDSQLMNSDDDDVSM